MLLGRVLIPALTFAAGVAAGGYLFSNSQPRSFLALTDCVACYRPNDLAGLLVSAGIQRAPYLVPHVVMESDRCIAIEHPFPRTRTHFVVFPKKDIRNIADIAQGDEPYVLDCLGMIRALVLEHGLRNYRVVTNGPDLQDVTYLHFHLVSGERHAVPARASTGRSGADR
ncbi:MAG TPA: HIT domain-containing protein [Burkholderiaceae bacterium]|nr:HIT domain-containing protein [Burkholderiaceae bacterium]